MNDADRTCRYAFLERRVCQRWRCTEIAFWSVWSGYYCDQHAIEAGWLPGAVRRPGTQLELAS